MSMKLDITDENKKSELKMKIGRQFRAFRKAIGKTQAQLARELEVHPSIVARIENGKIFPSIHYLKYLHKCYLMNSNCIFSEKTAMFLPVNDGATAGPEGVSGNAPWFALDVAALGLPRGLEEIRSPLEKASQFLSIKRKYRDH